MSEEHLHVRPAPRTIAICEIAAHIASCEASAMLGILLGNHRERWGIESVLFDDRYLYPPRILKHPLDAALQALSVAEVAEELDRKR